MIEVCLTNNQRFFVHGTESDLTASMKAGFPIKGFTSRNPGETSRVWHIVPSHIVSFSDVEPQGEET